MNWINPRFSGLPSEEIRLLKKTINTLSDDYKNKFLITHYQFIGSLLANNTYSFNRTYDNVAYPDKNNKYHKQYKEFFLHHLLNKKIEAIYVIKPLEKNVFEKLINKNCFQEEKINKILTKYLIIQCEQLKNRKH